MELRRIRYFLAVAEELHFGRAAKRLYMAQPPLSEQIRKLENELGVKLFDRTSRNVTLTEAGKIFLGGTRRAMDEVERATHAAQQAERGLLGHLVIGCVSSASVTFLPKLLRDLRLAIPDLQPELRVYGGTDSVKEALLRRTLDIGFVRPPITNEELDTRVIFRDRVILALPQEHPLARCERIKLAQLRSEIFILFPQHLSTAVNRLIERVFIAADFKPRAAQFADDIFIMLGLVGAGLGVAFVPASLAEFKPDGVAFRPFDELEEYFEMALAWRVDDTRPIVKRAVEQISVRRTSEERAGRPIVKRGPHQMPDVS